MIEKLGSFEGRKVDAGAMKLSGSTSDRVGHLEMGEQIFLVVKGTVAGILHSDVKDIFTRTHKIAASALVILEPEVGRRMLDEGQMIADERFGIENLFRQAEEIIGDPSTGEVGE